MTWRILAAAAVALTTGMLCWSGIADQRVPGAPSPTLLPGNSGACHSCSLTQHDLPTISDATLLEHLDEYAGLPLGSESSAIDQLLFHGDRTRTLLRSNPARLPARQRAFLERELNRTHARVFLRVVDAAGNVVTHVDGARVPLDEKQHLMGSNLVALKPHEFNGTVKRVGLHHLWTRM